MPETLTERQAAILRYLHRHWRTERVLPSMREIAQAFGLRSTNAVSDHLRALERKGYLRRRAKRARSIELMTGMGIPVIGRVAAGTPIEAIENVEREVDLPEGLFLQPPDYLLRVRGDSMIGVGILDGDLIAVRKQSIASAGEIVVARLDEEVTVKVLAIEGDEAVLLPANAAYEPIRVAKGQLVIEGVYVGLLRDIVS